MFSISVLLTLVVLFWRPAQAGWSLRRVDASRAGYYLLCMDSAVVPDAQIEAAILPYRDSVEARMGQTLCVCDEDMVSLRPESSMTRLLSDILLSEVRRLTKSDSGASPDFAMLNVGGIRSSFHKGVIRLADVFQVAPFENSAVVLRLDSAGVAQAVAHMANRGGEAVSHASFHIDENGVATGISVGGEPLCGGRTYNMVTLDYLATGGDEFDCLVGQPVAFQSGITLRDLIVAYLARLNDEGGHLTAPSDARIIVDSKTEAEK